MWLERLSAEVVDGVRAMLALATEADGIAPISEQAVLSLATGSEEVRHTIRTVDDVIVGYANLTSAAAEHPAMAEVVVRPGYRDRGIGSELVESALAEGGAATRVWAHGDLAPARAVAARLALRPARELLQLRRSLTVELPDLRVPPGLVLRGYAGVTDDAELLRVNNAAFDWHPEQGGWTERDLEARRTEPWFDPAGLFLAERDGRVQAFHWTKVHLDERPPIGEVYIVAVDPAAQGRGLGTLVTLAGLRYLRDKRLDDVVLYTEADNSAAVATYERLGFQRYRADIAYARPVGSSS